MRVMLFFTNYINKNEKRKNEKMKFGSLETIEYLCTLIWEKEN